MDTYGPKLKDYRRAKKSRALIGGKEKKRVQEGKYHDLERLSAGTYEAD